MSAIQIADSFDVLSLDHQPDGWPAVQQKQLTQAALMLRKQHEEIQEWRNVFGFLGTPDEIGNQWNRQREAIVKLRQALDDAATSLETIQLRSYGDDSYLNHPEQMRGYAGSRGGVVRQALADTEEFVK